MAGTLDGRAEAEDAKSGDDDEAAAAHLRGQNGNQKNGSKP